MDLLAFSDRRGFHERILRLSWNAIRSSTFSDWRRRRHLQALQTQDERDEGYETVYEALTILREYHLISWDEVDRVIEIHPVVQITAQRRHKDRVNHQEEPWEVALTTLSEAVSWDPLKIEGVRERDPWNDRWIIHTHLISCVGEAQSKNWFTAPGDALQDRCEIGLKISIALGESGKLKLASQLQRDTCIALENLASDTRPEVAILYYKAMNELGISTLNLGGSEEALRIQQQIHTYIAQSTIEFDPFDVLAWKANLAQTYFELGSKEESLKLREEVLDSYPKKTESPPHEVPYIQFRMDVADSLESLGRTPEAIYHRHMALVEYLGIPSKHWNIDYLERLLSKTEAPNRVEVALLRGIAKSYHQFGRYLEALEIREKILEWEKKVLPESHTALLDIYSEYATTKEKLGQDVADIRHHVYDKTRQIFSDHHPRTVAARVALAEIRARCTETNMGIYDAYELLRHLLTQYPSHHVSVLYVKDRISHLKVLSPNEEDRLEALNLQQEIYDARRGPGLDGTYDTLVAQLRIADCLFRLHRHFDAFDAHSEALERGLQSLTAYKPGTQERQAHPLVLTTKAGIAQDSFRLSDPLCSCSKPGDTCNNILPSPNVSRPGSIISTALPTLGQQDTPLVPLMEDFQWPLDGRHIDISRDDIDQVKLEHMERAIGLAREVLRSRIDIFSERHKSTIKSFMLLAEVLDFDDPFENGYEVKRSQTQIKSLKAQMSIRELLTLSIEANVNSQQRVKDWVESLDDAVEEPCQNNISQFDNSEISFTDEHMKQRLGKVRRSLEMVSDDNSSLFQDLSEGTKRPFS
ncbi:uncharacterized protein F4822DRAFT_427854 [Hypoxylon trugodes]|uniref:uncharacterized protein n=1 Tax=Hypoxylon trugodes TaxID=326681 RepID=UPI00219062FE|nr:uncharacterized protein F4822DRAFT_427854 [Hypoxylon trugodes]KAI1389505.1 hypothetical protein F4822DRAFT_427854 [Hypoxylon trugodes]